MSELTSCNYCNFNRIKKKAKELQMTVTKLDNISWDLGGIDIYVHPSNINNKKLKDGRDGKYAKYWVSWFWELPTHCCC